jgi:capsular exopolysaccharide synthesis family protein
VGEYDKPFANDYFHFTLRPKQTAFQNLSGLHNSFDGSYYFLFNDPASLARAYLKNLTVKLNDKNSEIIRLQLTSTEPARDIDYLNQLVQVYMQNKMNFQTETQKKSLEFIDKQLVGISDSLNKASNNFTSFKSRNQIINVDEQGKQVMEKLKDIETEALKNQMQLDYFNNLYQYLGTAEASKQLISPSVVGIADVSLNSMVAGLIELYSKRQILSFTAKEDNPALTMINKQINQLSVQLKENMRNLIKSAEAVKKDYVDQEKEINSKLSLLPEKEQDMINFQRRYELSNTIYTFMLQKRAETDIALNGATPQVQIIDAARMETTDPVGLSKKMMILIGLLLGLVIPAVYLLIQNMVSDTIELQEDVEQNTQLPILGTVVHSTSTSETAVHDHPRSNIAESYRGILTNLQFMLNEPNKKVVAIHSTAPGEGKSFTSVNLSTILAMNNKKVILIGTDLRKPKIHKIFNLSNEKGLSTYLSSQDQLEEVLHHTYIENLTLIPAGPIPPNPSELLDKPEMANLLYSLREKYDYIILDNAPVGLVTDGQLCGKHADLNIFILRHGVSKKEQIGYINQLSESKMMANIALVVNDIQGRGFGYGNKYYYYNYHYKYYDYGYYEENHKPVHNIKKLIGKIARR